MLCKKNLQNSDMEIYILKINVSIFKDSKVLEFTVSIGDLFEYVFVISAVSMSCVQLELCRH